jgi:hypothetical protein
VQNELQGWQFLWIRLGTHDGEVGKPEWCFGLVGKLDRSGAVDQRQAFAHAIGGGDGGFDAHAVGAGLRCAVTDRLT